GENEGPAGTPAGDVYPSRSGVAQPPAQAEPRDRGSALSVGYPCSQSSQSSQSSRGAPGQALVPLTPPAPDTFGLAPGAAGGASCPKNRGSVPRAATGRASPVGALGAVSAEKGAQEGRAGQFQPQHGLRIPGYVGTNCSGVTVFRSR